VPHWDFDALAGCGALRSTANDQLRFVQANLGSLDSSVGQALAEAQHVRYQALVGSVGWAGKFGSQSRTSSSIAQWRHGRIRELYWFRPRGAGRVVILANYGDGLTSDSSVDKLGMEILKYAPRISWE